MEANMNNTRVNIHEAEVDEVIYGEDDVYIHLTPRIKLFFYSEEEALAFFERGRDLVLEGGEDENE
jgi:hypothetical protein